MKNVEFCRVIHLTVRCARHTSWLDSLACGIRWSAPEYVWQRYLPLWRYFGRWARWNVRVTSIISTRCRDNVYGSRPLNVMLCMSTSLAWKPSETYEQRFPFGSKCTVEATIKVSDAHRWTHKQINHILVIGCRNSIHFPFDAFSGKHLIWGYCVFAIVGL